MTSGVLTSTGWSEMSHRGVGVRPLVLLYFATIVFQVQTNLGGMVMSGNRLLLLLLIIPLMINLVMGRYGRLLAIDILFLLHCLWMPMALVVNNPDRVLLFVGSNVVELLGGYLVGRAFIRNAEDFRALCKLFAWLAIFVLPLALYETMTGNPLLIRMLNSLPGLVGIIETGSPPRLGLERVQGFLAHPIHYGLFMSLAFSLVFVGFKGLLSNTVRYGLAFVVLVCSLLSLSSGPLLALVIQCGLILWAWVFRERPTRWLILLCVAIALYVTIDLLSDRTPFRVFLHYATLNSHTAYWRAIILEWGMVNVWANPVFGIGLNDWVRPVYMYSGSVDNFWLLMAMRYGIPGFLFLAVGYGIALWRVGRRDFDGDQIMWQFRRAWMVAMMGLTFALCTVSVWGPIYSFVFFFFGAGMWFITSEPNEPKASAVTELPERSATPVRRSTPSPAETHIPATSSRQSHITEGAPYTRFPARNDVGYRRGLASPTRKEK